MTSVGMKSINLARSLGCSDSYISHLLKGDRQPDQTTDFTRRLAEILCGYADGNGRLAELGAVIGLADGSAQDEFPRAIIGYLYKDSGQKNASQPRGKNPLKKGPNLLFGKKLDQVMEIADLSNSKLARLVNIDSSSISRYRTGKRSVRTNSYLILKMCSTLYEHIQKHDKLSELDRLIEPDAGEELTEEFFIGWLCGDGDSALSKQYAKPAVEELQFLAPEEVIDETLLADTSSMYIGNEGLRKAVLRFLITAAKAGGGEMKLYSDLQMDWMTGSREYFQRWYSLMGICIRRGVRISIIHNVDRRKAEMSDAVQGWMPLYMEGSIQSYYSTRQNGKRFYNTLFFYRYSLGGGGGICIKGDIPAGLEDIARYQYLTEPEDIDFYEKYYTGLLKNSSLLMRSKSVQRRSAKEDGMDNEAKLIQVIQEQSTLKDIDKDYINELVKMHVKDKKL